MNLLLEDLVPYDESALWAIHDAFYAERGQAAWTKGDVPYAATNNSGFARQHARLVVELVRELVASGALAADEPVAVLEVGCGHGAFALNFMDALAHGCGEAGRALAARFTYLLTDSSRRTLDDATAHPAMAALVASGAVAPALFDLHRPDALPGAASPAAGKKRGKKGVVSGGGAGGPAIVAAVMNYIACVSPLKVIRGDGEPGGEVLEKHVRLTIPVADEVEAAEVAGALGDLTDGPVLPRRALLERVETSCDFRPIDLDAAFERAGHADVVRDVLAALGPATIHYPYAFLDLVAGLAPRLVRGGLLLVSDFGTAGRSEVQAPTSDREPIRYGLSLAHDVDLVVLDAFAARAGLSIARTPDDLRELHTAAICTAPELPAGTRAAFERTHARRSRGQELLDLSAAAAASFEAGRHAEAARLYELCLRIAPRSPQVLHRWGQACLAADTQAASTLERLARLLRRGRRLDVTRRLDWDTLLGAVHLRRGELDRARALLERSLVRDPRASKYATLALVLEAQGDLEAAWAAHRRALELEPEGATAEATAKRMQAYVLGDDAPVRWSPRKRR